MTLHPLHLPRFLYLLLLSCSHALRLLRSGAACLALLTPLYAGTAYAGQVEEPLADSVRNAMYRAVHSSAPPIPSFQSSEQRFAYMKWLQSMSERLKRHQSSPARRLEILQTVYYESKRAGLDPSMVLAVITVESAFRKYAVSSAGARGYMQVMPFWARLIGDGDAKRLFHMQTNIRFGCVILRHYLDMERGDLFMALGRYNGSRGRATYPDLVFGAEKRWLYTPSTP